MELERTMGQPQYVVRLKNVQWGNHSTLRWDELVRRELSTKEVAKRIGPRRNKNATSGIGRVVDGAVV